MREVDQEKFGPLIISRLRNGDLVHQQQLPREADKNRFGQKIALSGARVREEEIWFTNSLERSERQIFLGLVIIYYHSTFSGFSIKKREKLNSSDRIY